MQWIAMLTMLIDHVGAIFFPGQAGLRIIGRIAFPIYAYALVQGYQYTSSRPKYLLRLIGLALVAQLPFQLALGIKGLNVIVTLCLCCVVLQLLDKFKSTTLAMGVTVAFAIVMEWIPMDYGAYGLFLVLIFRYLKSWEMLFAHLVLNLIFWWSHGWFIQLASIAPTIVIAYGSLLWHKLEQRTTPRWLWRGFYPAHLVVLALISYFLR
jgi:hypothetical protein